MQLPMTEHRLKEAEFFFRLLQKKENGQHFEFYVSACKNALNEVQQSLERELSNEGQYRLLSFKHAARRFCSADTACDPYEEAPVRNLDRNSVIETLMLHLQLMHALPQVIQKEDFHRIIAHINHQAEIQHQRYLKQTGVCACSKLLK